MAKTDCVFCQIVAGDSPAVVAANWPDAIAIQPLNPVVKGHVLVIPRAHVWSFVEDPTVTAAVMARAADFAGKLGMPGEGVNLITSAGEAATQTVFHLHVHLVPRYLGDGITLPWTGQHD
jgi:histidine triad (HIT) family protein